jgi:pimeloyl-ACP methyl ester carboxylesterase
MIAARTAVDAYLAAPAAAADERLDEALRTLGGSGNDPASAIEVELLEKLVRHAKPPLHETHSAVPGEPAVLRIRDDPNPDEPTEYAVLLPPEYVPWRAYPAVVVLHGAESPRGALEWLAVEAARRGYILIAPEYNLRGQPRDYRYTPSEHAAITLALRDAKRRFAIDSDRVFLTGQMLGGQAAFDFGLAHPDLFAGVAPISGLPAKYVWSTKANAAHVPLYVAIGDLAPTESDFVFGQLGKPLILKNYDITYVEYYKRALEPLPEEAAPLFDWMAGRKRDPAPKELDAVAAREGDDRFFGLVIRDFARGRTVEPSVADPLGRNLRPATVAYESKGLGTLLNVTTNGITRLDIWIHPSWVDVAKRFEVRVNRRAVFRGMVKADLPTLLEDLRTRGDRQQIYWFRLAVNLSSGRGGI